jgi:hypothetical protein
MERRKPRRLKTLRLPWYPSGALRVIVRGELPPGRDT